MQKVAAAKGQLVLVIPAEAQKLETTLLPRGPQHSSSGPQSHCSTTAPSPHPPLLVHLTSGTSPDLPTLLLPLCQLRVNSGTAGLQLLTCRAARCRS